MKKLRASVLVARVGDPAKFSICLMTFETLTFSRPKVFKRVLKEIIAA
jgi:hypothetical protein